MSKESGAPNAVLGVSLFIVSVLAMAVGAFVAATAGYGAYGPVVTGLVIAGVGLVLYIWFWIWAIIAIGTIAERKGYSKAGFVIFAVFLPIFALIVALVLQPSSAKRDEAATAGLTRCPYCAELIQPAAVKCKHCGERLGTV